MSAQHCMLPLVKPDDAIFGGLTTFVSPSVRQVGRPNVCCEHPRSAPRNRKLRQACKRVQSQRCVLAAAEVPAQPSDNAAPLQRDPSG